MNDLDKIEVAILGLQGKLDRLTRRVYDLEEERGGTSALVADKKALVSSVHGNAILVVGDDEVSVSTLNKLLARFGRKV